MLMKVLDNLCEIYDRDIMELMREEYLDSGRARTDEEAMYLAVSQYETSSDDELIDYLQRLGVVTDNYELDQPDQYY